MAKKKQWPRKTDVLSVCHQTDYTDDPDQFDEWEVNPGYELLYELEGSGLQLVVSFFPRGQLILLADVAGRDLAEVEGPIKWSKFRIFKEVTIP